MVRGTLGHLVRTADHGLCMNGTILVLDHRQRPRGHTVQTTDSCANLTTGHQVGQGRAMKVDLGTGCCEVS